MELAKNLWAIDEEWNSIKEAEITIDWFTIRISNQDNNIIVSIFSYLYEAGVNITTESVYWEEVTNNNWILWSRVLRGDELYELLDKVLK